MTSLMFSPAKLSGASSLDAIHAEMKRLCAYVKASPLRDPSQPILVRYHPPHSHHRDDDCAAHCTRRRPGCAVFDAMLSGRLMASWHVWWVQVPGEYERATFAKRSVGGIPVAAGTYDQLIQAAVSVGIDEAKANATMKGES